MQLKFISVLVKDQAAALDFYTNVLGFEKMADMPMGTFRWLTVTPPDGPAGVELVLEPIGLPAAGVYQQALVEAGMPSLSLITRDIAADYARLQAAGVKFRAEPQNYGPIISAVFEDTCGNLVNLVQPLQ